MIFLDEVGDDFGIGFGRELVALCDQALLEGEIVLDDSVVHDHEGSGAGAVSVGIFFAGASVGSPAGGANAVSAVEKLIAAYFFKIANLACAAATWKTLLV